jgi:C-terminal processing protease CtpA/Prc
VYEIINIRKNSAADKCGLQKGDIIVSINKILPYKYSLQQINNLLKSEDDAWITMEIERNSLILKFRFKLEDEL